jgi:propionate CoA-transferase
MILKEIAPGVDLDNDIRAHMEFEPIISPDLRQMDPALFREHWGGLQGIMENQ